MKSDPFNGKEKAERVEYLKEIEKKCESKEKQCLYPDCASNRVIKAHSIQNNRILNSISDNGSLMTLHISTSKAFFDGPLSDSVDFEEYVSLVYTMFSTLLDYAYKTGGGEKSGMPPPVPHFDSNTLSSLYLTYKEKHSNQTSAGMSKRGTKHASIFKGFCNKHDTKVFASIEKHAYTMSKKQNFLFAYRAFVYEYSKRLEDCCFFSEIKNDVINETNLKIPETMSKLLEEQLYTQKLKITDLGPYFDKFSAELRKKDPNYNTLQTEIFTIPFFSLLAASATFCVVYDLHGNLINDIQNSKIHYVFFNLFPQEDKTYAIFSYFKSSASIYEPFFKQMKSSSNNKIQNIISNLAICYTNNLFVSPKKYESLTESEEEKINQLHNFVQINGSPEKEQLIEKPPINLFQKFKREYKGQSKKRYRRYGRKR